ncbi:MAG: hypothetical protein H6750_20560 [Nitrospiraceae bacterium]|nr:hypothetical protein [Nitrospiraceae bacterium]
MDIPTTFLLCITGPDRGKRLAISTEIILGRSTLARFSATTGKWQTAMWPFGGTNNFPRFRAIVDAPIFVDGHRATERAIAVNQQLRIGRYLATGWRFVARLIPG